MPAEAFDIDGGAGEYEDYITKPWEIGERTAHQMIEEWPPAERLNQALGEPATASHIRALLPVVARFGEDGLDAAAGLYEELRDRAQTEGVKVTATLTGPLADVRGAAGRTRATAAAVRTGLALSEAPHVIDERIRTAELAGQLLTLRRPGPVPRGRGSWRLSPVVESRAGSVYGPGRYR